MSLKKQFLKSKDVCKVTFRIGKNECPGSDQAVLVGLPDGHTVDQDLDFGHVREAVHRQHPDEVAPAALERDPGRAYQFRYLLDGERWQNDWEADGYSPSAFPPEENSVVRV